MYYFYKNSSDLHYVNDSVLKHESNSFCYRSCSFIIGLKYICKLSSLDYKDVYLKYSHFDDTLNRDVYILTNVNPGFEGLYKSFGIPYAIGFCVMDTSEV